MTTVTTSLIVAICLALIGVGGDTLLRIAGAGPKFIDWKFFLLGFIVYASTAIGWFFVMKHLKFATIGVFFGVSSLVFLALVGHFYFKETLNIYEIFGIALGIFSIILLGKYA